MRVVTAPPYYPQWRIGSGHSAWLYRRETLVGVTVRRCPLYIPKKQTGLKRLVHLASFAVSSFPVMLAQAFWRPDVVLAVAPPLMCAPGALITARLCGARTWLHIQDFELDAARQLGLVGGDGPAAKTAKRIESWLLGRFGTVSTISRKMVERAIAKGVQPEKTVLFPNWADIDEITPSDRNNETRREIGAGPEDIVLLYAGNIGAKQGLEMILDAAELTAAEPKLRYVIAGDGAARRGLEASAKARNLRNVRFLPVQPAEKFAGLLAAGDIHLVVQKEAAADLVLPSKVTNILAAGRPMIVTAGADTELGRIAQTGGFALRIEPEKPEYLRDAIIELAADADRRCKMGRAARKYAEEHLDVNRILEGVEALMRG